LQNEPFFASNRVRPVTPYVDSPAKLAVLAHDASDVSDLVTNKTNTDLTRLDALPLDAFERSLLPLIRRFVRTFESGDVVECCRTFDRAVEQWGEPIGLSIAHLLQKLILAIHKSRKCPLQCFYPRQRSDHGFVSEDERILLTMLHHMRRDQTARARDALGALTGSRMSPDLIRASLTFSNRYAADVAFRSGTAHAQTPLRVVR